MVTTPLRQRMQHALRRRNLSHRTTHTYISLVARFAAFFHRSPDRLGLIEIEHYLSHIRDVLKVSYCLFNQTVCALRFFDLHVMDRPDLVVRIPYGRREKHYPIVLSATETLAILGALQSLRDRVLVTVLYSAGLCLGELSLLHSLRCPATALSNALSTTQYPPFPMLAPRVQLAFPPSSDTLVACHSLFLSAVVHRPTLAVRYFPHVGPRLRPTKLFPAS